MPDAAMKTTALTLLLATSTARGDARVIELAPTCVQTAGDVDSSLSAERDEAAAILARVLEEQDQLVVESGCAIVYTLGYERTGGQIVVHVRGPNGARRARLASPDALAATFRQIVRELGKASEPTAVEAAPAEAVPRVAVTPVAEASSTPDDDAPVAAAPTREPAAEPSALGGLRGLLYARVGRGALSGGDGPAIYGIGYRRELPGVTFDGSLTRLSSEGSRAVDGFTLEASLLHELTPAARSSFYAGGGLAVGAVNVASQMGTTRRPVLS